MTTCSTCQRGPADDRDSAHCETVGHAVYHSTPACKAYASRVPAQPIQSIPMGGYVAQAPRPTVITCAVCSTLLAPGKSCPRCKP